MIRQKPDGPVAKKAERLARAVADVEALQGEVRFLMVVSRETAEGLERFRASRGLRSRREAIRVIFQEAIK